MQGMLSTLMTVVLVVPASAQVSEPVDLGMVTRIREEGFQRSQVMDTVWYLTDVYGPRLTNSPQQRKAAAWARDRLQAFGLENAALEPWGEFGLGWSVQRCVVEMTEPTYMPLIAYPRAWTLGLEQAVTGRPVLVSVEAIEDLDAFRGQLAGAIVFYGKVTEVESHFEAMAKRHDEESLAELVEAPEPGVRSDRSERRAEYRRWRELRSKARDFFGEEGVGVVIEPDSGRRNHYGVIMLGSGGSRDPSEDRALPQVVVATEHFNRVARLLDKDMDVTVSVDVRTSFHDDELQAFNVVAEIPGADPLLANEVVMLGGHFDSWHPGTGATDNGASCAVAMEAARILKAVGAAPRRTIRVALWTGEEQGLLGSEGYVKRHFGDPETVELLPEHSGLAAYFNLDNGAGKIRGVYLQGNAAVKPVFSAWLEPFADLGATALTMRNTGGTDHLSFDAIGLPGFQFIQEPMDYGTRSHHTNMDLYERVHPGDVMQAAVVMASFAYHAAMRDEKLPRKPLPEPTSEPEAASN